MSAGALSDRRTTIVSQSQIRDTWIKQQLESRVDEFTDQKTLRVFLGTWNVNGKKEPEALDDWLIPPSMTPNQTPDIYAIGIQEIVDLNAAKIIVDRYTAEPWISKIRGCLTDEFVHVGNRQLVGILLAVFVRKEHFPHVSEVMFATSKVGVMGVAGNKGGVAIRFALYDSTVCIMNSHLAAHQNNIQGRNANFRDIVTRTQFTVGQKSRSLTIDSHDYTFWIGDLNYRLNLPDTEDIFTRIEEGDFGALLPHDQLLIEKASGAVFQRYREGRITFPPTYKYQPNTNDYERRPDKKQRAPAWCDRILWTAKHPDQVQQLFYTCAQGLLMSDHKPVMSIMQIPVKVLVKAKQNQLYQALVRQLDAWENQQIPKITMSSTSVHFSAVRYDREQTQTITCTNEGEVIVQFQFKSPTINEPISKPWLKVDPEFGIIPPGQSLDLLLTVHVDKKSSFALNAAKDRLDDILIMDLENGRDYFIPVDGDWLQSCIGSSIEYLVMIPKGVRFSTFNISSDRPAPENILSIPKELWRIVDYIHRHDIPQTEQNEEDLFTASGNATEVDAIIDDLDRHIPFVKEYSVQSMCEVLLRFLDSIAKPVIPYTICIRFPTAIDPTAFCKQCLLELPLTHYNVLIFLISFLREMIEARTEKQIVSRDFAMIFGKALSQTYDAEGDEDTPTGPAVALFFHFLVSPAFS